MLDSLLKQIIAGVEEIAEKLRQPFQNHQKATCRRRLRAGEIAKLLETVTSLRQTFICVDALGECVGDHRREVLDSLRQILEKWSGGRNHQGHYREYSRHVSEQHERKSFLHWVLIDTFRFLLVSLIVDAILRETTATKARSSR